MKLRWLVRFIVGISLLLAYELLFDGYGVRFTELIRRIKMSKRVVGKA